MEEFGAKPLGSTGSSVRVWAPNATAVGVIGDFCNWDEATSVPLSAVGGGFWEGIVARLTANGRYELLLTRGDGNVQHRMDPAARDTDHSALDNWHNKSSVVDTVHAWTGFTTPAFDDLIVYQCHVGSFCGYRDGHVAASEVASFAQFATKLRYIRELGFNAIQLLPVQEFRADRSWGYNPSFYFALESAYGRPADLRALVDACHATGLAVLFDVVYNHISDDDSSFFHFDEIADGTRDSYLGNHRTQWGWAPAFWRKGIKDFFVANLGMYLGEYNGDGVRFDATRAIEDAAGWNADGWRFMQHLTGRARHLYPGKYLVAEHLPDHESIVSSAGFHATWVNEPFERICRALGGADPLGNIAASIGNDFGPGRAYPYSWNTVKYLMGAHDECGDMKGGRTDHRYFVERFGGRHNWYARAKARMAWALNVGAKGTPMMFMGNECHMPGYWHDGWDENGDHRFDWSIAGDWMGMGMRHLVQAANQVRWAHPALRNGHLQITHRDPNGIVAFKRWNDSGDLVLVVVNASDASYGGHGYGVETGHPGRWQQILCSQDAWFGGWDGAGNAYHEPWTQSDGRIYVNIPQWSVTMFRLA
jgi:1,4-alpha-glucan branching enzyme